MSRFFVIPDIDLRALPQSDEYARAVQKAEEFSRSRHTENRTHEVVICKVLRKGRQALKFDLDPMEPE